VKSNDAKHTALAGSVTRLYSRESIADVITQHLVLLLIRKIPDDFFGPKSWFVDVKREPRFDQVNRERLGYSRRITSVIVTCVFYANARRARGDRRRARRGVRRTRRTRRAIAPRFRIVFPNS